MYNKINFTHRSLSSKVVDYLKREIFTGKYKGGERIIVNNIAEKLSISEEPVRKAIDKLVNKGLIKKIPRKGSFVVEFTQKDVEEIFDIRVLLENRVLKILINENRLEEEDYKNLKDIVDDMVEIAGGDYEKEYKIIYVNEKDIDFHMYLWEKSESKRTVKMLKNIYDQLQLAMIMDSKLEGSLVESAEKHYEVLKYLKNGNIDKTKKAIIDHIVTYKNQLRREGSLK